MTKRLFTIFAVLAAAAITAGCGGSGSGNATEDALSYMPKDAPVVISIQTDPDGDQYKRVNSLLNKFPLVSGQVKQRLKQGLSAQGYDFDRDIKPILGNDFVVTIPTAQALQQDDSPALGALKVKDEGKAEDLIKKDSQKAGSADGTDFYKSGDSYIALDDGTLLVADTTQDLEGAIKRHDGDDHMTEDDLKARMAGLEGDGILKVGVNVEQAIAASPEAAQAKKVKWVAGLRDAGVVVSAEEDGLKQDFKVTTEGVSEQDLPLAPGADPAPVVRRATDIGFGLRNFAQTFRFFEQVGQITDPSGFSDYKRRKQKFGKALSLDVDRDLIDQLQGNASVTVGLDGGFAVRSDLKDPAKFQATLKKATPKLEKALADEHVGVAVPKKPGGFYALATPDGKKYIFAVRDGKFVLATDAARAGQFAVQSASPVPGTNGSLVVAMDTRSIANEVARRQNQSGASLITGALGDLIGSVQTETSGMTGSVKLNIK